MKLKVKVPVAGMVMAEGTLSEWLVAPGESVSPGQPLCLVEFEKTSFEIEAPAAGHVAERFVAAGDAIEPGQTLVVIET